MENSQIMREEKQRGFFDLLEESLKIPFRNPYFIIFAFFSSLPLFSFLIMYETVFQQTMIKTLKNILQENKSPYVAFDSYLETLVDTERLTEEISSKFLLYLLYSELLHLLDLFNMIAIVDVASIIYKGEKAMNLKDMLSRCIKETRLKGPLITSIYALLLDSLISIGLVSLVMYIVKIYRVECCMEHGHFDVDFGREIWRCSFNNLSISKQRQQEIWISPDVCVLCLEVCLKIGMRLRGMGHGRKWSCCDSSAYESIDQLVVVCEFSPSVRRFAENRSNPKISQTHSRNRYSVPKWEKDFCFQVGGMQWKDFLEAKKSISPRCKVMMWDDSEGKECFYNARYRFWAVNYGHSPYYNINHQNPDRYIDKIDWNPEIDPQLLVDLEEALKPVPYDPKKENNPVVSIEDIEPTGWDACENWAGPPCLTGLIVGDEDGECMGQQELADGSASNW
ncbi:unnamed protein product [Dovyalis caffra]|uniref:Uncharacterized protein n=1 Tax=Dovyalis caffra TaxID=77055 RepID=A0AAV1SPP0_9ROSI|nr:unnamed protein product [Dovyalis caffra]